MRETFAFDIDGVIVDVSKRLKLAKELARSKQEFWKMFFSEDLYELDRPRPTGIEIVKERSKRGYIILITGRPKRLFRVTLKQVIDLTGIRPKYIYMRKTGDTRPSFVVKLELIEHALNDGFKIIEYHDDEEEVLRTIMNSYPNITLYLHYNDSYKILYKPPTI